MLITFVLTFHLLFRPLKTRCADERILQHAKEASNTRYYVLNIGIWNTLFIQLNFSKQYTEKMTSTCFWYVNDSLLSQPSRLLVE